LKNKVIDDAIKGRHFIKITMFQMYANSKNNDKNSNITTLKDSDDPTSRTFYSCGVDQDVDNISILERIMTFIGFVKGNKMLYNESDLVSNGGPY